MKLFRFMRKSVINFLFVVGMLIGIFGVYLIYATSDNNYVVFGPQGNLDSSDGTYIVPGGIDYSEGCKAPIYLSDTFPPSEVEPPLPDPSGKNYSIPDYICGDFSVDFCKDAKDVEEISKCLMFGFDSHAINFIKFTDENGNRWVCFVEPIPEDPDDPFDDGKFRHVCMPEDEWNNMDQDEWVVETLCKEYYLYDEEKCNKPYFFVPFCEDVIGEPCSPPGEYKLCTGDDYYEDARSIQCRCYGRECIYVELEYSGSLGVY